MPKTNVTEITEAVAIKVRDTVDAGLVRGVGRPTPGHMCVEAAVCYAMGLPHSDEPTCVSPALRRLKIRLNDASWSSPDARAKGLRRLAVAQLGSAEGLDEQAFHARVAEMTIRKIVPVSLRAAARRNPAYADALEAAAVRCEQDGTRASAAAFYAVAAADDAASAASAAAYAASAAAASRDRVLAEYAEWVVEILIDLQAPGCQWLYLVPKEA